MKDVPKGQATPVREPVYPCPLMEPNHTRVRTWMESYLTLLMTDKGGGNIILK